MTDLAISIKNIAFSYDKNRIYEGFSLDIKRNEIFFIMGINGSGKTTLLKILCSFLQIESGQITINGKDLYSYDTKSLSRTIAYVPQVINLSSDFLVKDYLALGRTPYKRFCSSISDKDYAIVEYYAVKLGIGNLLDTEFNTLSGGQKQTVAICRALIQESAIIIMDEPMSALDLGKQAEFLELLLMLKNEGKTIVLTSHNPNHALALKDVSSICLIHNHSVFGLGPCRDVMMEKNISAVYGDKVFIDENSNNVSFRIAKEFTANHRKK